MMLVMRNDPLGMIWQAYRVKDETEIKILTANPTPTGSWWSTRTMITQKKPVRAGAIPPNGKPAYPNTKENKMLLSDAIMLGTTLSKPLHNSLIHKTDNGLYACAFGAAQLAVGTKQVTDPLFYGFEKDVDTIWPWLPHKQVKCPECGSRQTYGAVVHLNDQHRWARERIASWVATIEPPEAQETANESTTQTLSAGVDVQAHADATPIG